MMDKDNIEITFTEEEKKSFSNPASQSGGGDKTMPGYNTGTPYLPQGPDFPKQKSSGFLGFLSDYDGQQKTLFWILLILFVLIMFFLRFSRNHIDNSYIAQNPPSQGQNQGENGNPTEPTPPPQKQSLFLSKGEEAPIVDENNQGLAHILVGVGWDPISNNPYQSRMDVDSSVILVDENYMTDFVVYYLVKQGPNMSVIHHGDNLTGENNPNPFSGSYSNDDENIDVYLNKIPLNYNKIYFILNIFEAYSRNQTLSIVQNMYINIYDPSHNTLLMTYQVTGETQGTGILLGVATRGETTTTRELPTQGTRSTSVWTFRALGNPYFVKDINELKTICKNGYF